MAPAPDIHLLQRRQRRRQSQGSDIQSHISPPTTGPTLARIKDTGSIRRASTFLTLSSRTGNSETRKTDTEAVGQATAADSASPTRVSNDAASGPVGTLKGSGKGKRNPRLLEGRGERRGKDPSSPTNQAAVTVDVVPTPTTDAPQAKPTSTSTSTSTSKYPRPSPPSYFYPQALVPRHHHNNNQHLHQQSRPITPPYLSNPNLPSNEPPPTHPTTARSQTYRPAGNLFTPPTYTPIPHSPHHQYILRPDTSSSSPFPRFAGIMASSIPGVEFPEWSPAMLGVLFAGLGVGVVWCVVVGLVNARLTAGTGTVRDGATESNRRMMGEEKLRREAKKGDGVHRCWKYLITSTLTGKGKGWSWMMQKQDNKTKEKGEKPIDKPSKHALRISSPPSTPKSGNPFANPNPNPSQTIEMHPINHAISTATPRHLRYDDSAATTMRKRSTPHQASTTTYIVPTLQTPSPIHIHANPFNSPHPPYLHHPRPITPIIHITSNANATATAAPDAQDEVNDTETSSSPENPYLPRVSQTILRPRTSHEYRTAHARFFHIDTDTNSHTHPHPHPHPRPYSSSPSSSPSPTLTHSPSPPFTASDLDDLEAQTALPPKHRRAKSESRVYRASGFGGLGVLNGGGSEGGGRKRWSGANLLDAVDGAVTWGVDKMVRWTEEGMGEEGLLLPLKGKGKMG
ncbi:hypothetical protein CC80DRAFT_499909 [Byssothecium circinans]|uniref:Uncharacterized protein n=1 Tax=Byssothecium circinans TaxID=147558 RepID=A0A6A5UC85_9PLEO|nr:hypothetical protein CC80DRAFT_499909 [Byssothecium circinans]